MGQTPRPADVGISTGQILLGKYRVEQVLGHGGMGIVARCTHIDLNEQVALKLLRADVAGDSDAVERFLREAQNASKLKSEYVARVSDYGKLETGLPYMVMEFLEGQDLGQMIDARGTVATPWAVEMVLQTCEALAEAHSLGIVHRDVKPTNLFVTWRPDGTALVKVLDFGISKMASGVDMQLTQTQSLLGTPAYMSPEQMRSARQVDARTDIWSLGTVLYELLEGHRPFEAESFSEMCVKVAVDPPTPMRNTPPGLQPIVLRCLAKMPEQRYASMAELGRDLIPFAQDPHEANRLVERMARMLGRRAGGEWDMGSYPSNPMIIPRPTPAAALPALSPASSGVVEAADTHRERSAPAASITSQLTLARKPRRTGLIIGGFVGLGIGIGVVIALSSKDPEAPAPLAESNSTAPVEMRSTPPATDFAPLPPTTPPTVTPPTPTPPAGDPTPPPADTGSAAPPADTGSAAPPTEAKDGKKKKPPKDGKKTGKAQAVTVTKPPVTPPVVKPPPPPVTKPETIDPFDTPRPPK